MTLYHYCSNAALLSIAQHKQIWLSELSLSNDTTEGRWLRQVFQDCCAERKVPRGQQDTLLAELDLVIELCSAAGFCMSEEGDLLSQWRAYADNGGGVAIGLDESFLYALGHVASEQHDQSALGLKQVEYDEERQKKSINDNLDDILKLVDQGALSFPELMIGISQEEIKRRRNLRQELGMQFLMYLPDLFAFKNPAFREEREWRMISHLFKTALSKGLQNMLFRAKDDRVVPYLTIDLAALADPAIKEVIIGPRNITPTPVIERMLRALGWENVSVRRSTATYR